jgi:hypothetical protein
VSAESIAMGLLGGFGLIFGGVLLWVLTTQAAREKLDNNPVAGIRTAATMASAEAWTAGHRAALPWARRLGIFGVLVGLLLAITTFLPGGNGSESTAAHPLSFGLFAVGWAGLLLGCVPLVGAANRAARQAEREP